MLSCSALTTALAFGAAVIATLACLWLASGGSRAAAAPGRADAASMAEDGSYQAELGRLLDFSESDLEANRRGSYSTGQWLGFTAWFVGLGGVAFLLGYLLLAFIGIIAPLAPRAPWFVKVLLALGAVILEVAVARSMYIVARNLLAASPCQASGPVVSFEIVSAGRTGVAWEVTIGESRYRGPRHQNPEARKIVRIGEPHRVYCACASRRILSLEALPQARSEGLSGRRTPSPLGGRAP